MAAAPRHAIARARWLLAAAAGAGALLAGAAAAHAAVAGLADQQAGSYADPRVRALGPVSYTHLTLPTNSRV